MKEFKYLITSGCSFTDSMNAPYTWPLHLAASYDIKLINTATPSSGNNLIARRCIHAVHTLLKQGVNPADILVGVMWSSPDRHDMFVDNISADDIVIDNMDSHFKEHFLLTNFVDNTIKIGGWKVLNHGWKETHSRIYYECFYNQLNQQINTYEKIIWVDNYLKSKGVNYFMSAYTDEVFEHYNDNSNIAWMKEQIDYSKWLPVTSMLGWCKSIFSENDFMVVMPGNNSPQYDYHPSEKMHCKFVKEIILPYIEQTLPNYKNCVFKKGSQLRPGDSDRLWPMETKEDL